MGRSAFSRLHPGAATAVGGSVLAYAFLTRDPLSALLLALGALLFGGMLRGAAFAVKRLGLILGATLLFGLTNPFISHRGVTVLFYLGNGAVTLEAAVYGAVSGAMLANVVLWCEVLYRALPEEAALYYPGKILPRTTLVFTMALRFVPRLMLRMHQARAAQKAFHPENTLRNALSALQTGVALTLEECCEIARGMEERGYGQKRPASYRRYRFRARDGFLVALSLGLFACVLAGYLAGAYRFVCYPGISYDLKNGGWYALPAVLVLIPAFVEGKERLLWRSYKSKA